MTISSVTNYVPEYIGNCDAEEERDGSARRVHADGVTKRAAAKCCDTVNLSREYT